MKKVGVSIVLSIIVLVFACCGQVWSGFNCNYQQCIFVEYFDGDGDGYNDWCWLLTRDSNGVYRGRGYSWNYADNGYGYDAQAGSPSGNLHNGYYFTCTGTSDCSQTITPVSGTVSNRDAGTNVVSFYIQCSGGT